MEWYIIVFGWQRSRDLFVVMQIAISFWTQNMEHWCLFFVGLHIASEPEFRTWYCLSCRHGVGWKLDITVLGTAITAGAFEFFFFRCCDRYRSVKGRKPTTRQRLQGTGVNLDMAPTWALSISWSSSPSVRSSLRYGQYYFNRSFRSNSNYMLPRLNTFEPWTTGVFVKASSPTG